MTMTQLGARQTKIEVVETYRRNMKNKEPEAVNSASFSGAEFTLPDNVDELSPELNRQQIHRVGEKSTTV